MLLDVPFFVLFLSIQPFHFFISRFLLSFQCCLLVMFICSMLLSFFNTCSQFFLLLFIIFLLRFQFDILLLFMVLLFKYFIVPGFSLFIYFLLLPIPIPWIYIVLYMYEPFLSVFQMTALCTLKWIFRFCFVAFATRRICHRYYKLCADFLLDFEQLIILSNTLAGFFSQRFCYR